MAYMNHSEALDLLADAILEEGQSFMPKGEALVQSMLEDAYFALFNAVEDHPDATAMTHGWGLAYRGLMASWGHGISPDDDWPSMSPELCKNIVAAITYETSDVYDHTGGGILNYHIDCGE